MPRFQLHVSELGKEPRVVPLTDAIVVGRSRGVDLTVDDEEVGRKQFRIGVTSGFVVLEGLGSTNATRVDDRVLAAGEKTTVPAGAVIRVGKTTFVVESADKTDHLPPGPASAMPEGTLIAPAPGSIGRAEAMPEGTMVQPGPRGAARPPAGNQPPQGSEGTGGFEGPMHTMELGRPGAPAPNRPTPAAGRPATPAGTSPDDVPGGGDFGQTMAKGFRPGAFRPGNDPVPPGTQPTPRAQPAKAPAQAAPAPQAPAPQAPAPKEPAPRAPSPPPRATRVDTPPMAPPPAAPARPSTVAVRPEDMALPPMPGNGGDDLESRLHQSMPRLFVKSEGLKRRIRLLKVQNRVGRAETADVLLPHESVSEQHAEIAFDGTQWTLTDCGSTNGCIADGKHLRGTATAIRRNTLIGIGALQVIFVCVDRQHAARDQRDEHQALQQLVRTGRLTRDEATQIRQLTRGESPQSIAEVLLQETALTPLDWANALATARQRVGLLERIRRLFSARR